MALRVVRRATPVHSSDITGEDQCSLQTRRSENLSESRSLDFLGAPLLLLRIFPPGILRRQFLRNERNRRSWLRRPGLFTGNVTLRHWTFFDREKRCAGEAVEDEDAAHFCSDGDCGSAILPREKGGLRGDVVIPEVVVNHLEAPHEFARSCAQSYHGVSPLVVAFADATVIIGAGTACGDENEIALGVHRNRGPGVARARARRGLISPGSDGIPSPAKISVSYVKGANNAALHGDGAVVAQRGTGDNQILEDGRRGGDLIVSRVAQSYTVREINFAFYPEIGARFSGGPVQRD